jgi:tetratricopeptide (TPR) repeat protein
LLIFSCPALLLGAELTSLAGQAIVNSPAFHPTPTDALWCGDSRLPWLNILFVRGLEKSLEADIKPGYKGLGDYYNRNTIPPILSHLNQQRENFRDHFSNICFVFLLPKFAIRYFVRRAPDFYDWNSGIFEIPNLLHDKMIVLPQLHPDSTVQDSTFEGDFLFRSRRYEEAITSYDRAVATKPNDYEAWHSRGISLYYLGRYEEPITSYDRAIKIKPNYQEALCSRGFSLDEWGRYADG